MTNTPSKTSPRKDASKKPYRKPRLTVYGDLREITLKGGNRGDGGGKPKTKK
jgi:hypothetical protein